MLVENRNFLRNNNRGLLQQLNEKINVTNIEVSLAKNGAKTLSILKNNVKQYIHSSYDPQKEVEVLLNKYTQTINEGDPIIFIGLGMGYHIKPFIEKFNPERFVILEYDLGVIRNGLGYFDLTDHSFKNLLNIYCIGSTSDYSRILVDEILNNKLPKIITLPSYERTFSNEINEFKEIYRDLMKNKKNRFITNARFQERWVVNSLNNLPKVLSSSNFLNESNRKTLKNKPVVIVSAGPSLNEEFDHLKKIKSDKSAYIFSMGSAINALIENGIYPDAAFTYDPSEKNQFVFEKLKRLNLKEIPVVFGTSVGHETLDNYPGKSFHFVTGQDTVLPFLLNNNLKETITDAPSIAVMALQILLNIGCNPIVFAGQNLSFSDVRYADGISYHWLENELSKDEIESTFEVEAVNGGFVRTNEVMMKMKSGLEYYIDKSSGTKFFNTTKNGAIISGTEFVPLKKLSKIFTKGEIDKGCLNDTAEKNDLSSIKKNYSILIYEKDTVLVILKKMTKLLERCIKHSEFNYIAIEIENLFLQMDQYIQEIEVTNLYNVFLAPMSRHQLELISSELRAVTKVKDRIEKINLHIRSYHKLILTWSKIVELLNKNLVKTETSLGQIETLK